MTRTTIRDVARLVGVHYTTVSRALNPNTSHLVNKESAERIKEAARALDYTPNMVARGLKSNRTATIGVLVPDLTASVMGAVVRGIDDVVMPAGYVPLVVNTDDDPARERRLIDALMARGVEGLVVASARLTGSPLAELQERIPLVLANRHAPDRSVSSVIGDDEHGVALAVQHLAELGHHSIAHLAGPADTSTGSARAAAFRDAMMDAGLRPDRQLIVHAGAYKYADGASAFRALLATQSPFTAVVAANDRLAIGCYDVLEELGMNCPNDMSITGYNDMELSDKLRPALTSVSVPHHTVGAEAARLLLEQIRTGERQTSSVQIPVSLAVRDSTAPPGA